MSKYASTSTTQITLFSEETRLQALRDPQLLDTERSPSFSTVVVAFPLLHRCRCFIVGFRPSFLSVIPEGNLLLLR